MSVHAHSDERDKSRSATSSPAKADKPSGASSFSSTQTSGSKSWEKMDPRPMVAARSESASSEAASSAPSAPAGEMSVAGGDSDGAAMGSTIGPGVEAAMQGELSRGATLDTSSSGPRDNKVSATTRGSTTQIDPAKYNPASSEGSKLIGHEATHLAQARLGRETGAAAAPVSALEAEASSVSSALARGQQARVSLAASDSMALNEGNHVKVPLSAARKAQLEKMTERELEYIIKQCEGDESREEEKQYAEKCKGEAKEEREKHWSNKTDETKEKEQEEGERKHTKTIEGDKHGPGKMYTKESEHEWKGKPQSKEEKQENNSIKSGNPKKSTTTAHADSEGSSTSTTSTSKEKAEKGNKNVSTTRTTQTSEKSKHGSSEEKTDETVYHANHKEKGGTSETHKTKTSKEDLNHAKNHEEHEKHAAEKKANEGKSFTDKAKDSVKIKVEKEKTLHGFDNPDDKMTGEEKEAREKWEKEHNTKIERQTGHETKVAGSIQVDGHGKTTAEGGISREDVLGAKGKVDTKYGEKVKGTGEYNLLTTKVNAGGKAEWDPKKGVTVEGNAGAKVTFAGGSYKLDFGPFNFSPFGEDLQASFTAGVSSEVAAEAKGSLAVSVQKSGDGVEIQTGPGKGAGVEASGSVSAFAGAKAGFEVGARLNWGKKPEYGPQITDYVNKMVSEYVPSWIVSKLPSSVLAGLGSTISKAVFGEGGLTNLAAVKGGVEGTAGIGGEASFNLGLKGGRIKLATKLQGTIGLGVGGKLDVDLDAIDGVRFLALMLWKGGSALFNKFGMGPDVIYNKIAAGLARAKRWLGQQIYEMGSGGILDWLIPDSVAQSIAGSLGYSV